MFSSSHHALARSWLGAQSTHGRTIPSHFVAPLFCRCVHSSFESGLPAPRLNIRSVTANIEAHIRNAELRKASISAATIRSIPKLYDTLKEAHSNLNDKRHLRTLAGDTIRDAAKASDIIAKEKAMAEAHSLKVEIQALEDLVRRVKLDLDKAALALPNDTHPSSPIGPEENSIHMFQRGPQPVDATPSRDHVSIAQAFDLLDLDSAAVVTGTSWYYLRNEAALLEVALMNYALSIAVKHGYTPVTTPDVVRYDIAPRCGFQPREGPDSPMSQIYYVHSHLGAEEYVKPGLVLAATSEIPIAGMFANRVIEPESLPHKIVGTGHAFRSEAGARGADTRGLYRVHQFTKVELFVVSASEESETRMSEMLAIQQEILDGLDIPYRVLDMPTEELGASAYRKIDIEAWMPGRGSWGEVSSLSNCTDYQSRRMHIRVNERIAKGDAQHPGTTNLAFAHTLNGTAAAIPRLIVTLLENGVAFDEQGKPTHINLPSALQRFWIGESKERSIVKWKS